MKRYRMPLAKEWFVGVLCMTFLALLVGCENQKEKGDPKVILETLAQQYWTKRLVDLDYKSTYDMELEKESMPFSEYLKRVGSAGQITVLSIKTKEVKIEDDKGFVKLIATSRIGNIAKDLELPLEDVWINRSEEWKHQLAPKSIPISIPTLR